MTFKDILVHVDETRSCSARLELAVRLATAHEAHLTGLHVRPPLRVPGAIVPDYGGALSRLRDEYCEEAAVTARSLFEKAVAGRTLSTEYREASGDVIDTVVLHAKYADLVVIGQTDMEAADFANDRHLADHVVLAAGVPVLVVPFVGRYAEPGRRILVGWNVSREARRAIGDAMPFLKTADWVKVLAINPADGIDGHGDVVGADICLHLVRHGIPALCESLDAPDMSIGAMLLSRAAEDGADLLVMGGYGRSRLRELVLGGATRHVLHHMTLPVLLSH
jgi:nucleotide-binding universal stress UspA family protein